MKEGLYIPSTPSTVNLIDENGKVIDTITFTFQELKQNQKLRELVEKKITCNECVNCELLQFLLDEAKK